MLPACLVNVVIIIAFDAGKELQESVEGKQDKWWKRHDESAQMDTNSEEGKLKRDEQDKLSKWIKDTMDKYGGFCCFCHSCRVGSVLCCWLWLLCHCLSLCLLVSVFYILGETASDNPSIGGRFRYYGSLLYSFFPNVFPSSRDETGEKTSSSTDNLVKVRISKLSKSPDRKGSQPISIDAKDEKKLSKAVQEELEKAGLLDTQGRGSMDTSSVNTFFLTTTTTNPTATATTNPTTTTTDPTSATTISTIKTKTSKTTIINNNINNRFINLQGGK